MTNIFFDMEFTGLHKGTTPISIGLVTEYGRKFYAEFTDYDRNQVNDWIKENVISNLKFKGNVISPIELDDTTIVSGSIEMVKNALRKWISQFEKIQFISDVCHYDFVLLVDLLAEDAIQLPDNVTPACFDINTMIAESRAITLQEAFDLSREDLVKEHNISNEENKHNAMYDAMVIKQIYYDFTCH